MKELLKKFVKSQDGAITTEFLVLVAAVVGLGIASFSGIAGEDKVVAVEADGGLAKFVAGF